jgi:hypothetical protein
MARPLLLGQWERV